MSHAALVKIVTDQSVKSINSKPGRSCHEDILNYLWLFTLRTVTVAFLSLCTAKVKYEMSLATRSL